MKKLPFCFLAFILIPLFSFTQILTPVKWSFKVEQSKPDEATLLLTATIDHGWHIYSRVNPLPPNGPVGTTFTFNKSKDYQLIGNVIEPTPIKETDSQFDNQTLRYFNTKAVFKQKIKVFGKTDFQVTGLLEFMCCDNGQCIPPSDVDYTFDIKGNPKGGETATPVAVIQSKGDSSIKSNDSGKVVKVLPAKPKTEGKAEGMDKAKLYSLLMFFLFAFGGGLVAIVTPCVFPMIPMTVTFFMHDSGNKRKARFQAIVYSLSIILIYTLIGTILALTLGANFANFLSTHWIPNIFFFLIFMIFAASFLGMFEITLPGWMVSKADKQADKGGVLGSFFMAFTLVLVSFSCTGPIVALILVKSAGGEVLLPIVGMLGFSIAFALPFGVFAFIPSLLASLPKSGGWLNSVKVVLGFIELAFGLKFLSIPDQTYHWHLLDREVYLAFWIVICILLGFYLLGKLKFRHDSDVPVIGVPRLILAIITFTFVVYMIPGMWGAPLKALAGYLPPQQSLDFDLPAIIHNEVKAISVGSSTKNTSLCDEPKYKDLFELPHQLEGYFDYKQALACSRKQNKPLFIDFTGISCVNCREMEARVWVDPAILKRLRENFIITALYVDDKTEVPQNEWVTSKYDGKVKKTIGKIYADLQIARFNVNAQPYYVLLDTTGNLLTTPQAYDLNVNKFIKFLDTGLQNFKNQQKK